MLYKIINKIANVPNDEILIPADIRQILEVNIDLNFTL